MRNLETAWHIRLRLYPLFWPQIRRSLRIMVLLIGLTGPLGSGKSSVAEILSTLARERGIQVMSFSLSDEIRKEVKRQGVHLRRDALKQMANVFRSRIGNGVWALLVASRIEEHLAMVEDADVLVLIDAIRNPGEVYELRTRFGNRFKLLGVTASFEGIRENLRRRSRSDEGVHVLGDERALQDLIESEMGSGEPSFGHNVEACMEMTDFPPIHNDGSLAALREKVRALADQQIFPLLRAPELSRHW
jgi:dephospho-CoA kinase